MRVRPLFGRELENGNNSIVEVDKKIKAVIVTNPKVGLATLLWAMPTCSAPRVETFLSKKTSAAVLCPQSDSSEPPKQFTFDDVSFPGPSTTTLSVLSVVL